MPDRESVDQLTVAAALLLALVFFAWGRWRYDAVALGVLLALVIVGVVPAEEAFAGFGHPAVITVAAVLVVGRGLENSGAVDAIARQLLRAGSRPTAQVASSSGVVAVCSAFMNNVGALALLMPVAIRIARQAGNPRALLLMPLAFASLLGGMVTLVGTPPNIIIATARAADGGEPFAMFDFTPVGAAVMVAGLAFLSFVGWRLIPRRPESPGAESLFDIHGYLSEVQVPEGSELAGRRVGTLQTNTDERFAVVALIRGERRRLAPAPDELMYEGDVLVIEADADLLAELVERTDLAPVGSEQIGELELDSEDVRLVEAVVRPGAFCVGRSARDLWLRERYGVNLLAIAREGGRIGQRLHRAALRPGDVILLQGAEGVLPRTLAALGCLPLAERGLRLRGRRSVLVAVAIFGIALIAAAGLRLVPIQIAVTLAAIALGFAGFVSLREAYEAIDWPVLVLLGAMLPVGAALEATGAAARVADALTAVAGDLPFAVIVAAVLITAMLLSDVVNNAAAAVLLAPIAIRIATGLDAPPDALLMAVAIGASSAFLTPIGHQSNILVMGPGGYRFSDYWRVGLPLEIVIALVAVPMIVLFWGP